MEDASSMALDSCESQFQLHASGLVLELGEGDWLWAVSPICPLFMALTRGNHSHSQWGQHTRALSSVRGSKFSFPHPSKFEGFPRQVLGLLLLLHCTKSTCPIPVSCLKRLLFSLRPSLHGSEGSKAKHVHWMGPELSCNPRHSGGCAY